jgi:hypothetical protein
VPRLLRRLWLYKVCRWLTNGLVLGSGEGGSSELPPEGGVGGSTGSSGSEAGTGTSRADSNVRSASSSSSAVVNRSPRYGEIDLSRISANPGARSPKPLYAIRRSIGGTPGSGDLASHGYWPSFYDPKDTDAVELIEDRTHGMVRTEVRCARCGSHLGHVFEGEGYPTPTDQRYCINSISLRLTPDEH